jgi:hypothetical protein
MKAQTLTLGNILVRYELGDTWFDGALKLSNPDAGVDFALHIGGTDHVLALRDFLNSLDFSGPRLSVVKSPE